MYSCVLSAVIQGMEVLPIQVEADVSDGLPSFSMVGYVTSQVKEAQDRVRTALRNMSIALPPKRITVNLAPADIRKEGAGFDLPVALAILAAVGQIPRKNLEQVMALGELSLNGVISRVNGVLPIVRKAKELHCKTCMIPRENLREGRLVEGIRVVGVADLDEAIAFFTQPDQKTIELPWEDMEKTDTYPVDFQDIKGQEPVKRAAAIAVAGMHNLLMIGPPGSGKSMIARRIPTILPPLTHEESLEISAIYSIAGMLPQDAPILRTRPFRSPHHSASAQALAGGGRIPKPGEITLAHRGVLFLDEMPEFSKKSLEILRQPMEERCIHISRVQGTYTFPANFMLVAAMNPCKCGYYPDMNRCTCSLQDVSHYLKQISQPLVDRMDLCVEAGEITYEEMTGKGQEKTSEEIRKKIEKIHGIQQERYRGTNLHFNADLTSKEIKQYCRTDREGESLLKKAFQNLKLSARAYHRILKVSRTIADMEESDLIRAIHISEAIGYRTIDRKYWSI